MDSLPKRYYVVEHMEEFLFKWSTLEYFQILKYLKTHSNAQFVVSNVEVIKKYQTDNHKNKQQNEENWKTLTQGQDQIKYIDQPIHNTDYLGVDKKRICLLDLRGEKLLSPEDSDNFDMVIFGGILGDHPPRDRTSALRKEGVTMRHLGNLQLSTDTAILVSKLILENKMKFDEIPFIDEPEMKGKVDKDGIEERIQMEGFRYVSQEYDIDQGKIVKNEELRQKPLMDETIKNELMFEEFDLDELILE